MAPAKAEYVRRRPEKDPLHQVLSAHLLTFLDQAEQDGPGLPAFVKKELLGYLDCGLLCKGAIRVACSDCKHSLVMALSCKGRGICPSCGGLRMNDTAAHLVDRVLPDVPVRQFVLSLPHRYRFVIAKDALLLQGVVRIFVAGVFGLLVQMAKTQGVSSGLLKPGAVVATQRFGDGLIYNAHLHGIFLQGVYHRPVAEQPPVFVPLPAPTQEQVAQVAVKFKKRVDKLLRKRGKLPADGEAPEQEAETLWEKLCAASIQGRIAMGPKAGWRIQRLSGQPVLLPPGERHLCAEADGFNLHAHTSVGAGHKAERERLCRYILRPALSGKRLSLLPSGDVLFRLKRAWSDGTRFLVFPPIAFVEKLAVLVPPPNRHLLTYHGILSSASAWRKEIIPSGQAPSEGRGEAPSEADPLQKEKLPEESAQRPRRLLWAQLLSRTFGLDVLCCPKCGGRMKLVAAILDPVEITRLCQNLGEPTSAPQIQPSHYQAQTQWDFADPP